MTLNGLLLAEAKASLARAEYELGLFHEAYDSVSEARDHVKMYDDIIEEIMEHKDEIARLKHMMVSSEVQY